MCLIPTHCTETVFSYAPSDLAAHFIGLIATTDLPSSLLLFLSYKIHASLSHVPCIPHGSPPPPPSSNHAATIDGIVTMAARSLPSLPFVSLSRMALSLHPSSLAFPHLQQSGRSRQWLHRDCIPHSSLASVVS